MISAEVLGGSYLGICRVFLEEIPGGIGLRNDLIVGILVSLISKAFQSGLERLTPDSSWLNVGTLQPLPLADEGPGSAHLVNLMLNRSLR
ncbi:hypothetical protein [Prochlorococcus marinus]|uniref:hypothetical protein n=1 Tax=Prochlorococcus marinus TaxID=1219 RepID=UPI0007B3D03A|nr:hypothetical protein [Prochlorococcus marinus]